MISITTLPLGAYQTNCYVVRDENSAQCVVIDPGYGPEIILAVLKQQGLELAAILLTHGHFDHVGAVRELVAATDCQVYLQTVETTMPQQMTAGSLYYTKKYPSQFQIAGLSFRVLSTPGHTPGSVCLLIGDAMFSGDTLFAGSCGRTDLPGGDWATIRRSLAMLRDLPGDYRVFPGHGEATTLEEERRSNPYLR